MVTLYDVARSAGVSIATVSRVLHGQEPVRETTRARVRTAIEELGYVPDGAAQSLARSRKDVIGLVCVEHTGLKPNQYDIESMSLLFYDEVMRGVEARIRELSWSLLDHLPARGREQRHHAARRTGRCSPGCLRCRGRWTAC